jgi:hypothetical protein
MKNYATFLILLAVFNAESRGDIRVGGDVDSAVERALGYLARTQRLAATQPNGASEVQAAMAFLIAAHVPGRGPLGLAMSHVVDGSVRRAAEGPVAENERAMLAIVLLEASLLLEDADERVRIARAALPLLREPPAKRRRRDKSRGTCWPSRGRRRLILRLRRRSTGRRRCGDHGAVRCRERRLCGFGGRQSVDRGDGGDAGGIAGPCGD